MNWHLNIVKMANIVNIANNVNMRMAVTWQRSTGKATLTLILISMKKITQEIKEFHEYCKTRWENTNTWHVCNWHWRFLHFVLWNEERIDMNSANSSLLLQKSIPLSFSGWNGRGKDCFNGAKMRLIKQRREFHYLQLFHFVSVENTQIEAIHEHKIICVIHQSNFTVLKIQFYFWQFPFLHFLHPTLSVHITAGPFLWNGHKTQLLFDVHSTNLIFIVNVNVGSKNLMDRIEVLKRLKLISGYILVSFSSKSKDPILLSYIYLSW